MISGTFGQWANQALQRSTGSGSPVEISSRNLAKARRTCTSFMRSTTTRSSEGTISSTVTPSRSISCASRIGSCTVVLPQMCTRAPTMGPARNCQTEMTKLCGAVCAITSRAESPNSEMSEARWFDRPRCSIMTPFGAPEEPDV